MKKRAFCSLAVVAAMASLSALSGCNGKVVWDVDAPAFGESADVTFGVNGKKNKGTQYEISDTLFGVFLEDINFASYYLDDDLIMNGSFDAVTRDSKYGWSAVGGATFEIQSDAEGVFKNTSAYQSRNRNPNYARVKTGSQAGGIRNSGYVNCVPFAVQEGTNYVFSAFVRNAGAAFDLTVQMSDGTKNYLEAKIPVSADSGWVKYTRTITASGSKNTAGLNFELKLPANTEAFFDGISLETTDSTVGIKNIPYQAIKDLSPKFIRFPGGCIIEGNGAKGDECAYDWKNSIGAVQNGSNAGDDVLPAFTYKEDKDGSVKEVTTYGEPVTRKPNPDLWAGDKNTSSYNLYYDMTYAIGFYEYFLLCESVGASAVPVVNCGYSCQGGGASNAHGLAGRHGKKVEDYIRDAVDLIEFAKGGKDTKWGKIRSDMGHPEPFEMSYLGIGNEQFGVYYTDYYEKFLEDDAFMSALSKYSVKPIVGNGLFLTDCEQPAPSGKLTGGLAKSAADRYLKANNSRRKIETMSEYGVVDQHYYVGYPTLLEKYDMYDEYVRPYTSEKGYEVFVGEYSANGGVETAGFTKYVNNEWITALSEAAMMTGYERNGDVIKLAAYAPMFGRWGGGNQWNTDMMYYTNNRLILSANYYVQQLFMKNQGAYRIMKEDATLEWHNDLSPTFTLAADDAGSSVSKTVNKLYYVASCTKKGDVILKIVNVSGDTIKADVALSGVKLRGNASVTVLQCDDRTAKNTLTETNVMPESYAIGAFTNGTFGYEIKPYSVTSVTVHVR